MSLKRVRTAIFQNNADKRTFTDHGLVNDDVIRISPGSGINLNTFRYRDPVASSDTIFLLVARMVYDKGINEFVEAARIVRRSHDNIKFQLLGPLGVENRTAVPMHQMEAWITEGVVDYMGETDRVIPFLRRASCVVLPSYREGTSRVLLEACSIGRPVIATDVPGCREVVEEGINGFLCNRGDPEDLSQQMLRFLELSAKERVSMGLAGREKMRSEFDENIVLKIFSEEVKKVIP